MIVEARERSGALITADFALEDGREVFAVPGEITGALAAGTNRLLRQGATPLTSTEDVLEVFGLERRPQAPPKIGHAAARVLERLADAPLTADELGLGLALQPDELAAALAELELVGAAQESDGVYRAVMRTG